MNSPDFSFNRRELLHVIASSGALGAYRQDNGPTEITECTTIDESGEYKLGSDIDGTGDCLRIDTAEVVLDGNGHILQGDESGTGIECGEAGPVIRNLTVRGFETGIRGALLGPRLKNVTVEENTGDGIAFGDGYISCSGCTLQRNGGAGFSTGWDSEAELTNCDVRENEGQAIVGGTDTFLLDNCVVADNGGPVAVPPSPGEQKIVDTEIRNSASAGLKIIGSDAGLLEEGVTVQNCTIRDNEGPGIEHESSFLEVRECTIGGNQDGYRGSYSQRWRTVLRDNKIEGNDEYGVAFAEWFRDDADPIDARENSWGARTGPSSTGEPLEDPETATLADGDGDAIAEGPEAGVACARFDPYTQPVEEDPNPFFEVEITTVPDAVTRGETITVDATVENTGGAGTTSVSLFINEKQESVDSKAVELDEGAQTEVSLQYDTKSGDPPSVEAIVSPADEGLEDTETIPVEEKAPFFEVNITTVPDAVTRGETITVDAAIKNTGGPGSTVVSLLVDENKDSVDSEAVELDEGAQTDVSLQYDTKSGDPPNIELTVAPDAEGVSDTETIPVEEKDPFFEVDITNAPETVERGETITLDAAIENTGGPGSMSVSLFIDETQEAVDSEAVELDEGAQTDVSLQYETKSGDPPSVEAIVSPADGGLDDTETISVEGSPDEPTVADYANENGIVDTQGLQTAIDDLRTGNIDVALLRDVMTPWQTGSPVD
jgi:hypothetical protein